MNKTAWVFPGQGSQAVGMGVDLQDLPQAQSKFEIAEKILNYWSVLDVCQGDEETLAQTLYTQPCLYVVESILADLLIERVGLPQLVAGHSLGEYVALYAARVFDFESGLQLVKKRAELMATAEGGKMAALMKFDRTQLNDAIAQNPDVVLANDNSAEQVVISGTPEAVESILAQVKAKRAVTLNVSGAFHSPLMEEASQQFKAVLDSISFADAQVPVLSNVEPIATTNAEELKQRLIAQMTGSVRWREIMLQLPENQITKVIEVGPGKVLTGLIKRTCRDIELHNVSSKADLDQLPQLEISGIS
ncbi:malonyl CoA-acyl carrier protein transacylase [Stanieria cyanosphaera PCC 7437]|uniref:Malonyl CoA-acyl carrier protein transacylase n=1 Tax=Stanieria cyanosphaera (strain ATCC 29371 / PCC 7437) TaxID=111780 RepID=K9XQJ1_STAC7|nr:ACP S-malonyltransferase [Stanieria cyanosphaera]AFZ34885.1 malonyl CoA-acyl carrier protein transacylase [Stanieria cyanosphaera PCC 7437]